MFNEQAYSVLHRISFFQLSKYRSFFCQYCVFILREQIHNTMIEKVKQILKDPKEIAMAVSGLSLLGFYLFYARKEILADKVPHKKPPNQLELKLKDLVQMPNTPNVVKVVITQAPGNDPDIEFRSSITSKLKEELLRRQLTTLVNCSPLKILKAGCQCLLQTLTNMDIEDEKELINYYQNSIRCQLVIQKTIIDIQSIKKEDSPFFILCDNNSLDVKIQSDQRAWAHFLKQKMIDEEKLKQNYQIVFHIRFPPGNDHKLNRLNEHIEETWSNFENYYEIVYDHSRDLDENVDSAIEMMMKAMKQFLPAQ